MHFPSFLLLAAAIPAVLGTATAQRVVRTLLGDQPGAAYGRSIAASGDVDGDGIRELVVGEPLRALGAWTQGGAVRLVRLGTGVTSVFSLGLHPGAQLGSTVAGIGDFDGDGIADFAAGAPQAGVNQSGRVRVLSGATGVILLEWTGEEHAEFGTAICAGGDIDLDGRAEVVISSPWASNVRPIGRVQTLDRNGVQWTQETGTTGSDDYGRSLASIGDVDGDGKPDYAIGKPGYDFGGSNSGCVRLQSSQAGGAVGLRWEVYFGLQSGDAFGRVVAAAGDVNGDGVGDVLVGDGRQRVHVLSGVVGSGSSPIPSSVPRRRWPAAAIGTATVGRTSWSARRSTSSAPVACSSTRPTRSSGWRRSTASPARDSGLRWRGSATSMGTVARTSRWARPATR